MRRFLLFVLWRFYIITWYCAEKPKQFRCGASGFTVSHLHHHLTVKEADCSSYFINKAHSTNPLWWSLRRWWSSWMIRRSFIFASLVLDQISKLIEWISECANCLIWDHNSALPTGVLITGSTSNYRNDSFLLRSHFRGQLVLRLIRKSNRSIYLIVMEVIQISFMVRRESLLWLLIRAFTFGVGGGMETGWKLSWFILIVTRLEMR